MREPFVGSPDARGRLAWSRRSVLAGTLAMAATGVSAAAGADRGSASTRSGPGPDLPGRIVLCFGDSNTWGYMPQLDEGATRFQRYGADVRWTALLQDELRPRTRIVDYGICGLVGAMASREQSFENGDSRAAIDHVRGVTSAHWPLDHLVVMLGTNDLAWPSLGEPRKIAAGVGATVDAGLLAHGWIGGRAPRVTVVSPAPLGPASKTLGVPDEAIELSRQLAPALRALALERGWSFLDAAAIGELDTVDGVHWSPQHHRRYAPLLANHLRALVPAT